MCCGVLALLDAFFDWNGRSCRPLAQVMRVFTQASCYAGEDGGEEPGGRRRPGGEWPPCSGALDMADTVPSSCGRGSSCSSSSSTGYLKAHMQSRQSKCQ
ncbi:hypothetical protein ABZP36_036063 [Zizania latifolia]